MEGIKFRAYDKKDKRYIVDEQEFTPLLVTNKGVFRLDETCEENRWIRIESGRFFIEECTKMKDINGVEIYEGDIIEYENYNGLYKEILKGIVYYCNTSCSFKIKYLDECEMMFDGRLEHTNKPIKYEYVPNVGNVPIKYKNICKIIGNIHENKELI